MKLSAPRCLYLMASHCDISHAQMYMGWQNVCVRVCALPVVLTVVREGAWGCS